MANRRRLRYLGLLGFLLSLALLACMPGWRLVCTQLGDLLTLCLFPFSRSLRPQSMMVRFASSPSNFFTDGDASCNKILVSQSWRIYHRLGTYIIDDYKLRSFPQYSHCHYHDCYLDLGRTWRGPLGHIGTNCKENGDDSTVALSPRVDRFIMGRLLGTAYNDDFDLWSTLSYSSQPKSQTAQ